MIGAKKAVIQAVLTMFETGKPEGDYGAGTILDDGAGFSIGREQATDGSGTADLILYRYIDRNGQFADNFAPYMPRLDADESTQFGSDDVPQWARDFIALIAKAGNDPIMQQVQDEIFDEEYWEPCVRKCADMKLILPLSWLIVYDTCIHSGPAGVNRIRAKFPEGPPSRGGDERAWAAAYAAARYNWLSNYTHEKPKRQERVRRTKRRVGILRGLIADGNWQLETPFEIGPPYRVTIS